MQQAMQAKPSAIGTERGLKIACSACFVLITVALLIIHNSPATGYELSIFSGTPAIVWVLLGVSLCCGIVIILREAFGGTKGNRWVLGFALVILVNSVVLTLHICRDYFAYASGDSVMHIQWSGELGSTGQLDPNNFYPIVHILMYQIAAVCGASAVAVARYFTPMLSLFSTMVCVYLLARMAVPKRSQALVCAAATAVLLLNSLHVTVYPHTFSYLLIPLALYLYFKGWGSRSWAVRASFVIALFVIPYSYPITALIVVAFLAAMELTKLAYDRGRGSDTLARFSANPVFISSITFFTWISSFYIFGATLRRLLLNLQEPLQNPYLQGLETTVGELQGDQQARLFLTMYGDTALYMILWLIGGLLVMNGLRKGEGGVARLSALFAASVVSIPLQLFVFSGTRQMTVGRLANLNYVLVLTPVFAGFVLYELFKRLGRRLAISIVTGIFVLTWAVGVLGVYHSPWIMQESWQITRMEVVGAQWFLSHGGTVPFFGGLGYRPEAPRLWLGAGGRPAMQYRRAALLRSEHFAALRNGTLGDPPLRGLHMLLTKRFVVATADPAISKARFYSAMGWDFTSESLHELITGVNIDKLYSNGEFDAYFARPVMEESG